MVVVVTELQENAPLKPDPLTIPVEIFRIGIAGMFEWKGFCNLRTDNK